jgi:hypothetical protein
VDGMKVFKRAEEGDVDEPTVERAERDHVCGSVVSSVALVACRHPYVAAESVIGRLSEDRP